MPATPVSKSSLYLLIGAALTLLAGDTLQLAATGFAWTVFLVIAFAAFAAGLLLLPPAFAPQGGAAGLQIGSALAFVGSMAGASMQSMFRAWEVLEQSSQAQAVAALRNHRGIFLTTFVPGLLFPLGLLVLAVALYRRAGAMRALVLALGAVLFPIGHAAGVPVALIAGDVVLLVAFVLLAAAPPPGGSPSRSTAAASLP